MQLLQYKYQSILCSIGNKTIKKEKSDENTGFCDERMTVFSLFCLSLGHEKTCADDCFGRAVLVRVGAGG